MNIPYHEQETEYTCGSACMKMALDSLGIHKSERQLSRLMRTSKLRGTWHKAFPALAERYKLNYSVIRKAGISDIKRLSAEGYIIILAYYYPTEKVHHYAVFNKLVSSRILLIDPTAGPDHGYTIQKFIKLWKSSPEGDDEKRWLFALKN